MIDLPSLSHEATAVIVSASILIFCIGLLITCTACRKNRSWERLNSLGDSQDPVLTKHHSLADSDLHQAEMGNSMRKQSTKSTNHGSMNSTGSTKSNPKEIPHQTNGVLASKVNGSGDGSTEIQEVVTGNQMLPQEGSPEGGHLYSEIVTPPSPPPMSSPQSDGSKDSHGSSKSKGLFKSVKKTEKAKKPTKEKVSKDKTNSKKLKNAGRRPVSAVEGSSFDPDRKPDISSSRSQSVKPMGRQLPDLPPEAIPPLPSLPVPLPPPGGLTADDDYDHINRNIMPVSGQDIIRQTKGRDIAVAMGTSSSAKDFDDYAVIGSAGSIGVRSGRRPEEDDLYDEPDSIMNMAATSAGRNMAKTRVIEEDTDSMLYTTVGDLQPLPGVQESAHSVKAVDEDSSGYTVVRHDYAKVKKPAGVTKSIIVVDSDDEAPKPSGEDVQEPIYAEPPSLPDRRYSDEVEVVPPPPPPPPIAQADPDDYDEVEDEDSVIAPGSSNDSSAYDLMTVRKSRQLMEAEATEEVVYESMDGEEDELPRPGPSGLSPSDGIPKDSIFSRPSEHLYESADSNSKDAVPKPKTPVLFGQKWRKKAHPYEELELRDEEGNPSENPHISQNMYDSIDDMPEVRTGLSQMEDSTPTTSAAAEKSCDGSAATDHSKLFVVKKKHHDYQEIDAVRKEASNAAGNEASNAAANEASNAEGDATSNNAVNGTNDAAGVVSSIDDLVISVATPEESGEGEFSSASTDGIRCVSEDVDEDGMKPVSEDGMKPVSEDGMKPVSEDGVRHVSDNAEVDSVRQVSDGVNSVRQANEDVGVRIVSEGVNRDGSLGRNGSSSLNVPGSTSENQKEP